MEEEGFILPNKEFWPVTQLAQPFKRERFKKPNEHHYEMTEIEVSANNLTVEDEAFEFFGLFSFKRNTTIL